MKSIRPWLATLVVLTAAFGSAATASAQCAEGPTKGVCSAASDALVQVNTLQGTVSPAHQCSLTRIENRLQGLLFGLPAVAGYVPEEFSVRTLAITSPDGVEFEQQLLFIGEPDEVVWSLEDGLAADPAACAVEDAQRAALDQALRPVRVATAAYNKPFLVSGAAQLRKLSNTWTWIITDGFGQFPWERLFNDLVHREQMSIFRLPRVEWVLLHPSVAASFTNVKELDETRGQVAFLVEPFGVTFYSFDVGAERRNYWGVSALVSITENLPPAVGGLVRFNKYSLGVARHLNSGDSDGNWSITATVELLERLQPARKKLQELSGRAGRAAAGLQEKP